MNGDMSRDPDATRARILAAATGEFAEHGVAGARYDRIAQRAHANKERIYAYFGSKDELFARVLEDRLSAFAEAHVFASRDDVTTHLGELFDFHAANPELTRLLLWEALHYADAADLPGEERRAASYRQRLETLQATRNGHHDPGDVGHLSFLLSSLVAWWFAVPHIARLHLGRPIDDAVHARQRQLVVAAGAALLASP